MLAGIVASALFLRHDHLFGVSTEIVVVVSGNPIANPKRRNVFPNWVTGLLTYSMTPKAILGVGCRFPLLPDLTMTPVRRGRLGMASGVPNSAPPEVAFNLPPEISHRRDWLGCPLQRVGCHRECSVG